MNNELAKTAVPILLRGNSAQTNEKIPTVFKPFIGKTPAQFLGQFIPQDKLEAIAGAMCGFADLGLPIPDWAKKSSVQFWKNYIGDKPLDPTKSAEDFGVLVKLLEFFVQGNFPETKEIASVSKLEVFLNKIAKKVWLILEKKAVSELSDEDKMRYYAGRVRANRILEKIQNPEYLAFVKRAKVYLTIAAAWRKIEEFKTHTERERWLRSILEEKEPQFENAAKRDIWQQSNEGMKFAAKKLNSREYFDIFEIIGLPGAAPGRPKKVETRALEIAES